MKNKKTEANTRRIQSTNSKREDNRSEKKKLSIRLSPYLLGFILIFIFCSFIYGDVFTRAEQDSFFTFDATSMKFLTDQSLGYVYWGGRFLLIAFKNVWTGALLLSLILTGTAWCLASALSLSPRLRGLSFLVPFLALGWMVWRGTSIYYKNEPSLIVLVPLALLLLSVVLAAVSALLRKHNTPCSPCKVSALNPGNLCIVLFSAILYTGTLMFNQNEILTARMQNNLLRDDFNSLVEDGLSARRPSRAVAAYYTIGLIQTDQLYDRLFQIPFNFPETTRLDKKDGSEEYGIFLTDCNFFAGLLNPSYHMALEHIVMNGPRPYYLKRLAICSVMKGEKELARKYMKIIESIPFEKSFVDKYAPMIDHPELAKNDPVLSRVYGLEPLENRFEQNYRAPAFLGYNIGLRSGREAALIPSIMACLYSKDLPNAMERALQLRRNGTPLSPALQQAIVIFGQKQPGIFQHFPELAPGASGKFGNGSEFFLRDFFNDVQTYYREKYNDTADWKQRMTADLKNGIPTDLLDRLKEKWLGNYVFYYYCQNIRPKKQEDNNHNSGVN